MVLNEIRMNIMTLYKIEFNTIYPKDRAEADHLRLRLEKNERRAEVQRLRQAADRDLRQRQADQAAADRDERREHLQRLDERLDKSRQRSARRRADCSNYWVRGPGQTAVHGAGQTAVPPGQ
jgi:hypothetical protein